MMSGQRDVVGAVDGAGDGLAHDGAHRAADEGVLHDGEDDGMRAEVAGGVEDGVEQAGLLLGFGEALLVGLEVGEVERVGGVELRGRRVRSRVRAGCRCGRGRSKRKWWPHLGQTWRLASSSDLEEGGSAGGALGPEAFGADGLGWLSLTMPLSSRLNQLMVRAPSIVLEPLYKAGSFPQLSRGKIYSSSLGDSVLGAEARRFSPARKRADVFVEELLVGGAGAGAGGVSPERGDGDELDFRDEFGFVLRVFEGEVEVGGGGHVEDGDLDRGEGLFCIAVETGRVLPTLLDSQVRALQDVVVGVGVEAFAEAEHVLLEGGARRGGGAPQLLAPPLLRVEPAGPDHAEGFEALFGLGGVVAVVEGGVGGEGGDLAFEADDAVAVGFGGAAGGDDAVHEGGIADRPLEGLLRAHREADDGAEMRDAAALR